MSLAEFALGFPLMLIIVFGAVALSVQAMRKSRATDDDDDLPPTGQVGAFA